MVQRGLAPWARELLANSSALEEAILGEQRRLDLGESQCPEGIPACGTLALQLRCVGFVDCHCESQLAAAKGVNFPHCPGESAPGALQRPTHPDFVTRPQDVEGPG